MEELIRIDHPNFGELSRMLENRERELQERIKVIEEQLGEIRRMVDVADRRSACPCVRQTGRACDGCTVARATLSTFLAEHTTEPCDRSEDGDQ